MAAETGLASWYGAPYHNRRGSNGQVYDMNAMTAAHRTLPLGSIVRVTNVKTGHAAVVRITDRGPFVPGRIVDLSLAAAKKTDVWQPGIARVRVEVLQTPTLLETSGRWAVQIGAFDQENAARTLAGRLSQRYRTAKVLCFNSPVGDWWVRVRVRGDDKKRAEELAHGVLKAAERPKQFRFLYELERPIKEKIEAIATKIYGADGVDYTSAADQQIKKYTELGYADLPICMAKTHLSISHDPSLKGRPRGFRVPIREVRASLGAGFLYPLLGEMRTMPGLPSEPNTWKIDLDDDGNVVGLF